MEKLKNDMEIIELTPEEYEEFREVSLSTWSEAENIIGAEYLNKIKDSIEKMGY